MAVRVRSEVRCERCGKLVVLVLEPNRLWPTDDGLIAKGWYWDEDEDGEFFPTCEKCHQEWNASEGSN